MNGNLTFLIVDDDPDDVDLFCEAVKEIEKAWECLAVNNGEEALDKLRERAIPMPDIIFLDLNMPLMDGRACLRELKKDRALREIPVIIYTTSARRRDRDETRALGADHFLTKPTSLSKLREAIENIIKEYFKGRM